MTPLLNWPCVLNFWVCVCVVVVAGLREVPTEV